MTTSTIQMPSKTKTVSQYIKVCGGYQPGYSEILSDEALVFLYQLHTTFNPTRLELLNNRITQQTAIDNGQLPSFLDETKRIRQSEWKVSPIPADLLDRRVEITGPVDRKMIINALNSGASVFMADFEDSNTPTWNNNINGQINLRDAVRKTIEYKNPKNNKEYKLNTKTATLMVRPRGWHLNEKHIMVHGEEMSGSLVDFGLYFFHNAKYLLDTGSGPYFYLPKLESHLEARLWNDVFIFSQNYLRLPQATIKATVLIETILAAFEMNEILYELREHSAGLNCGRWDYIFSFIKKFRNREGFVFPDRGQVTMTSPCMLAYSQLVIKTCHRRGVHAMGGMAAQIPIKNDPEANARAIEKVKNDKLREVRAGHDGTWVAHPDLVSIAKEIFDEYMPNKNQIDKELLDLNITVDDILEVPRGTITMEGIHQNINVGILYIESWLMGQGAAALHHLMEDAATAEISRSQLWQWVHGKIKTDHGLQINMDLINNIIEEEIIQIQNYIGVDRFHEGRFPEAIELFRDLIENPVFESFLTSKAYQIL